MFLGGLEGQLLTPLSKALHKDFHSLLRFELQQAGFTSNKIGGYGSRQNWLQFFEKNPGSQELAFDAVRSVSRGMDDFHGTFIYDDFNYNYILGNFKRIGSGG